MQFGEHTGASSAEKHSETFTNCLDGHMQIALGSEQAFCTVSLVLLTLWEGGGLMTFSMEQSGFQCGAELWLLAGLP